jgi:hypothetical protein
MDRATIEVAQPDYVLMWDNAYDNIITDIDSASPIFQAKNEIGERNYRWYKGEQWTEQEEEAHRIQSRVPFVFNEILSKIDHLLGSEKQLRFECKVTPRENSDNMRTDLLAMVVKWVEQVNNIDQVQSEVFQDAMIKMAGCVVVRWSIKDIEYGFPSIEKVPINEMMWDVNAKEPTLEDARWMARVMKMTKLQAAEIYPKHVEKIDSSLSYNGINGLYTVPSYREEMVGKRGYWYTNEGRDEIRVIDHHEKIAAYQYVVVDDIQSNIYKYDTYAQAKDFFAGLVDGYVEAGESIVTEGGEQLVYMNTVSVNKIIQTIIIGEEVVEQNLLSLPTFPYKILFAYFNNGDYFSPVDNMILPQMFANRLISQWDYSVGTSVKNAHTVKENLLRRGFSIEDLRREMSKTGSVIPVISHDAMAPLTQVGVRPELFQGVDFAINRMNDYAGGRNMMGMMESASESGKAVMARTQQAGVGRMTIFDRLSQWRKETIELTTWWIINFMTPGQIMRIIGTDLNVKYTELDIYVLDTLRELKYDITIDEINKSDSIKDRNFEQMWRLLSQVPALDPFEMMSLLLPFTSIPETQKENIKDHINKHREYLQTMEQTQKMEKLKQQATDMLARRKIKEQLLEDEQYQTREDAKKSIKDAITMNEDKQKLANSFNIQ